MNTENNIKKQTIDLSTDKYPLVVNVEMKNIKHVHLGVYPPNGNVKISAPLRMNIDVIRAFAIDKLQWIKKQQLDFKNQKRETPKDYVTKESHYFKGKRYLLKVVEENSKPKVVLEHSKIYIYVRPGTSIEKRENILDEWYRVQLKNTVPELLVKWEKIIGVQANEFRIKKMHTKWGTCNVEAKRIWLNLELAKRPVECLEYIIVHELVHLLERKHNERFVKYMNKFMPKWKFYKDELNRLPFRHTEWNY